MTRYFIVKAKINNQKNAIPKSELKIGWIEKNGEDFKEEKFRSEVFVHTGFTLEDIKAREYKKEEYDLITKNL